MLNRIIGGFVLLFVLQILPRMPESIISEIHCILMLFRVDNYLQPKDSLPKAPSTEIEIEYSLERALLDSLSAILRKSQGLEYDPDSLWFDSDSLWFDSDTLRFYSDSRGWENALDSLGRILSDTLNLQLSDSLSVDTIPQEELVPKEPELSPLHRYIRDYDIFKDRVSQAPMRNYRKIPCWITEDEPFVYALSLAPEREFKLEWREPKRQVIPRVGSKRKNWGSYGILCQRLARQILLARSGTIDKIRYLNTDLPNERLEVPLEANRPIQCDPREFFPEYCLPLLPHVTSPLFHGRLSNQLTQTYVSPTGSSGGVSNMSTLSALLGSQIRQQKRYTVR